MIMMYHVIRVDSEYAQFPSDMGNTEADTRNQDPRV